MEPRRFRGRPRRGTARRSASACRQRSSWPDRGQGHGNRTWWCSSDNVIRKGLQGVGPGTDVDRPRAAVVDDQHGRAPGDRLRRPGEVRFGAAADFEQYFTGTVGAAGGNNDHANGADQGFVPGHDQPLLTMPDLDITHYRLATQ